MNADFSEEKDPETYAIIGAAMEVHRELGQGLNEPIYQDAMAVELALRKIPFEREKPLPVFYKGGKLPTGYRADFVCFGNVLLECKALQTIGKVEDGQVLNYLRVSRLNRAVLVNFGPASLFYKRLVLSTGKGSVDLQGPTGDEQ